LTAGAADSSVRVHGEGARVAEIGSERPQGGEGEGRESAEREGEAGEAGRGCGEGAA
jgi:hypothetical protein